MLSESGLQNFLIGSTKQTAAATAGIIAFVALCCFLYLLCCLGYLALLILAIVTNQGIGSPALPFLLLIGVVLVPLSAILLSVIYTVGILVPITATTQWVCRDRLHWPVWSQPFAAIALLAIYLFILGCIAGIMMRQPIPSVGFWFMLVGCVLLAFPLGLHWWLLQAGNAATWLIRKIPVCN